MEEKISEKSRTITFLLSFFLGMLGVHRFYVGKNKTAIIQLLLTISIIGVLISSPWVFIDWIMIICGSFKDKEGLLIKKWE